PGSVEPDRGQIALPPAQDFRFGTCQIYHCGGSERARAAVDDRRQFVAVTLENFLSVVQGLIFSLGNERGGHEGRTRSLDEGERDTVIRHPDADGLARRVRHAPRHFLRGIENERVRTWPRELQEPVLPVVDQGEM